MKRAISLEEISDGKLYQLNDLVKVGCNDCEGCSAWGMGNSIVLDPLDIYRLTRHLNCTFQELLNSKVELHVVDGQILPNLKMVEGMDQCVFLDTEGRCSIHAHRPGFCRIFPLGRYYENDSFQYILQVHECPKENKTKMKVRKWIDTPDLAQNQKFVNDWHYFLKQIQEWIQTSKDETAVRTMNLYVLQKFYILPYDSNIDFYEQFYERLNQMKEQLPFN